MLIFYVFKWLYCRHWKVWWDMFTNFGCEWIFRIIFTSINIFYKTTDFWYWLSSNVLVSSEGIATIQKSLLSHTFLWDSCFLLQRNEENSHNKNHCGVLTLFPSKEYVRNSQKFKQHKDLMIYYIIQKRFLLKILFLCF